MPSKKSRMNQAVDFMTDSCRPCRFCKRPKAARTSSRLAQLLKTMRFLIVEGMPSRGAGVLEDASYTRTCQQTLTKCSASTNKLVLFLAVENSGLQAIVSGQVSPATRPGPQIAISNIKRLESASVLEVQRHMDLSGRAYFGVNRLHSSRHALNSRSAKQSLRVPKTHFKRS